MRFCMAARSASGTLGTGNAVLHRRHVSRQLRPRFKHWTWTVEGGLAAPGSDRFPPVYRRVWPEVSRSRRHLVRQRNPGPVWENFNAMHPFHDVGPVRQPQLLTSIHRFPTVRLSDSHGHVGHFRRGAAHERPNSETTNTCSNTVRCLPGRDGRNSRSSSRKCRIDHQLRTTMWNTVLRGWQDVLFRWGQHL